MVITKKSLERIGQWIKESGRQLEQARFNYHFNNGAKEKVFECLSTFQNEDGGFGHGLEADSWNPNSTPLTTSVALKIMFECGAHKENNIVKKAISYLVNNHFDVEKGTWLTIIPSNNDYPHAPWWTWEVDGRNTWDFNPGVEIAGFMLFYCEEGSKGEELAKLSFSKAYEHLFDDNKLSESFHEVYCYLNALTLLECSNKKLGFDAEEMKSKLIEYINATMCRDTNKWFSEYVAQPIDYMNQLNVEDLDLIYQYKEEMIKSAQLLIEKLPEDDAWDINWSWYGSYEEKFEEAHSIWKGVGAVEKLLRLRRLGLIEV